VFPGAVVGSGDILLLNDMARDAFVEWLSRHSYRITASADITKALFTAGDFKTNVDASVVDWVQEKLAGATQMIFRPSPAYDKHIIKAP
jgi:hypothetical protein